MNISTDIKRITEAFTSTITFLISSLAAVILLPLVIFLYCIFTIYRYMIWLILKLKYGKQFGGLVEGADAVHTAEDLSKIITNCLFILGYDENRSVDEIFEASKKIVADVWFQEPDPCIRFKFTFKTFLGYAFKIKCAMTADDCIKKMTRIQSKRDELDKDEFLTLMSDCCNSRIPVNEEIFWEILFSTQPIKMPEINGENGKKYYPVLFRIHHAITDGVSTVKVMNGAFGDHPDITVAHSEIFKQNISNGTMHLYEEKLSLRKDKLIRYQIKKFVGLLVLGFKIFCLFPWIIIKQLLINGNDSNILHGKKLSNEKIVRFTTEESKEYVPKIKRIKNRVSGTTFPDVLLTAFSASLSDYYKKKSGFIPKHICSMVPVLPGSADVQYLIPGQLGKEGIQFKNGFSMVLPKLYMCNSKQNLNAQDSHLIHTLKLIAKENANAKNSVDYFVNYISLGYIFPVLPRPFTRWLLLNHNCTAVVSIVAGPREMTFGKGTIHVGHVGFWASHVGNTGVSLSVFTYGGRLQVGLNVDKVLISEPNDVQNIVDGVFMYIDQLEKDSENFDK